MSISDGRAFAPSSPLRAGGFSRSPEDYARSRAFPPQAELAIADSLDRRFAHEGPTGPLHCVPTIVKDNFETNDLQTTAGSGALEGWVPKRDAWMVARIKAAGAIVLAKSNMAEWAFSPLETVSLAVSERLGGGGRWWQRLGADSAVVRAIDGNGERKRRAAGRMIGRRQATVQVGLEHPDGEGSN